MLINTENKRIELVYPTDMSGEKTRLITVDGDADDFERDKGIFRADTALYTAALAMSAEHETILKENLTELHYDRLSFISYDNHDQNRVGMALGIKERGDTATVIIVLRGTVGREWYSNFDVGYGTVHSGFLKAAEYAEQRLSDYLFIRLPQQQELRFLVTGYSRGGAVANILSKRLCDRYGLDAVRCYTFASPNTGITVKGALRQYLQHRARRGLLHPRAARGLGLHQIRQKHQPVRLRRYREALPRTLRRGLHRDHFVRGGRQRAVFRDAACAECPRLL